MPEFLAGLLSRASWSRFRTVIIASLFLSLIGILLSIPSTNLPFEDTIYDLLVGNRPITIDNYAQTPKIIIIAIDDRSYEDPGHSRPDIFSPAVWSEIVNALIQGGVKAVALHRTLPTAETRSYPLQEDARWFKTIENAQKNNVPIIYGFRHLGEQPLLPLAKFLQIMGRERLGFLDLIHDRDDKVRRQIVVWPTAEPSDNSEPTTSFSYLVASAVEPDLGLTSNMYYIDYGRNIPSVSFVDIHEKALQGQIDFFRKIFEDTIAIIGETASLNLDAYPTPKSSYGTYRDRGWSLMPAVLIQAHAINTLLNGSQLEHTGWLTLWLLFFSLSFLALTPVLLSVPRGSSLFPWMPALVTCLYPVIAFMAFHRNVFLPVTPGLTMLILAILFFMFLRARETKMIQNTSNQALNLYLNPALTDQIILHPEILQRRGEKRVVTVFFADLVGFTALAESISTEDMVALLNRYYDTMNTAIERFDGFVDKFVGDGIMAVWGAPSTQPAHAVSACMSALMQKTLMEQLNRELAATGRPTLFAVMGINTGQVIAGNIGAKRRINYTVMGDTVNLASRLVAVNKIFRTTILASEATVNMARDKVCFRKLDLVRVKGRKGSINIYEVLAPAGSLSEKMAQCVNYFERGLNHYWDRDYVGALARFEAALKTVPDDAPSRVLAERCQKFLQSPPAPDWDGVTVLEDK
ncbi:MAG: adenylate/guanylate cyclase domain-containing protein [Deltaproteobacteria bacterium]|jgi:class 3 adenylate cyclase/CHASE2 domain-containing sensor protein|nr:adenylate/guanylate cyclase domain-containing protein [Deltaproteobacteria bacterium]